jgi:hypothetical protein
VFRRKFQYFENLKKIQIRNFSYYISCCHTNFDPVLDFYLLHYLAANNKQPNQWQGLIELAWNDPAFLYLIYNVQRM